MGSVADSVLFLRLHADAEQLSARPTKTKLLLRPPHTMPRFGSTQHPQT